MVAGRGSRSAGARPGSGGRAASPKVWTRPRAGHIAGPAGAASCRRASWWRRRCAGGLRAAPEPCRSPAEGLEKDRLVRLHHERESDQLDRVVAGQAGMDAFALDKGDRRTRQEWPIRACSGSANASPLCMSRSQTWAAGTLHKASTPLRSDEPEDRWMLGRCCRAAGGWRRDARRRPRRRSSCQRLTIHP